MLSDLQIQELKEKYGSVYSVGNGVDEYVFRPLTLSEYEHIYTGFKSSVDAEDYIVDRAVVWPDEDPLKRMKPGVITSLAEDIMEKSAFTSPALAKIVFEEGRQMAQEAVNIMKAVVLACHSELGLSECDLNDFTFSQLAQKTALAEQIVAIKKSIYDPNLELSLDIIDPDDVVEADKALQEKEFNKAMSKKDPDAGTKFGTAPVDDPVAQRLQGAFDDAKRSGRIPQF